MKKIPIRQIHVYECISCGKRVKRPHVVCDACWYDAHRLDDKDNGTFNYYDEPNECTHCGYPTWNDNSICSDCEAGEGGY